MRDEWRVDALAQRLPSEPPGDPIPGGPWEIARGLIEDYRVADPAIVCAWWHPASPLLGGEMALELRLFRILRTHVAVRVTRVWDEDRGGARLFGYEYATLPGHVEDGRMEYEVSKQRDDGAVEFRLRAHWRPSGEGRPWTRIGFRLFGRRQQLRFYVRCCERAARFTARALGVPDDPPAPTVRLAIGD
jgi:hypothetical protein